jgi:hypothetical protein
MKGGKVFVWAKILIALATFGKLFVQIVGKSFERGGATLKERQNQQKLQKIQENDKTIQANREIIDRAQVLLEQVRAEQRETGKPYDSQDVSNGRVDMQFWLTGKDGSVIVEMGESFWDRLQDLEGKAWAKILTFVEEEYERREEEDETS